MLTRRENLLVRPWQQRRFQNHRRKVQSALPAIDASAPQTRGHVTCKLKKIQCEEERMEKIESDNVRLLQRMAAIMRTSRLDNRWTTEPPGGFLGRIGVYVPLSYSAPISSRRGSDVTRPVADETSARGLGRKATCPACKLLRSQLEAERQLPAIDTVALKQSEDTTQDKASPAPPAITDNKAAIKKKKKKIKTWRDADYRTREMRRPDWNVAPSKLVLTRGQLTVSVSFPSHTGVTIQRAGCNPSVLEDEYCSCASVMCKPVA